MRKDTSRRAAVLAAAALVIGSAAVGLAAAPPGSAGRTAPASALISGTTSYVDGALVWTDYAYDDRGPDSDTRPGGDAAYPQGMTPDNVADLIQLRLRPEGARLGLQAVLETLEPGTRPVVGVAVDLDGNPATGAATLPGSWQAGGRLGVELLYVLRAGGGAVHTASASGWSVTGRFEVTTSTAENTLTATVPLPPAGKDRLRVLGAVGYEDASGASWVEGASPVHDLAFVRGETPGAEYVQSVTDALAGFAGSDNGWQDHRQSAVLAGDADPAAAVGVLDLAKARRKVTEHATPGKGLHSFLYRSALRLGEGVQQNEKGTLYAGPYQPYLVWLPAGRRAGLPLVVYLHGSGQTHTSAVNVAPYSPETHNPQLNLPDALFDFPAVVAWPLGRGPTQGYVGASEQDVLDVTDDLLSRLALDEDRVMLAGLSMGGIGTFRLAELYPDRWSLAYSDVGIDNTGLTENLTALPVRLQNGAADYLVNVSRALATRQALEAAGTVDYASWILAKKHHQPAFALAECVYRSSFTRPRVENPARVRYTVDPTMAVDDRTTGLRLRYEGAYWVSGMRAAGPRRAGVDLTSHAFTTLPVVRPTVRGVHQNITAPRDFCGTDTKVSTRDAWDEQARQVAQDPNPRRRAAVTGTLTGLSAVTIDANRAGVPTGQLELLTDRQVQLTVTGLKPGSTVRVGSARTAADSRGRASVDLTRGENVVVVAAP
jgi:pimeloyl-ACP methyl ester carboxylesterase